MRLTLLLAIGVIATAAAFGRQAIEPTQLLPVDEAAADASFLAFREGFVTALRNKDARWVQRIVDPDVLTSFGPESGAKAFAAKWDLTDPSDAFWRVMLDTIALGGRFVEPGLFCAPYVYTSFPEAVEPTEHYAVTADRIPLRSTSQGTSPVLRFLSRNIVRRADSPRQTADTGSTGWVPVVLSDGTRGFVEARFLRSPLDYRACFQKKEAVWKLTVFVAGD